jgi:oligopeptide transport system ATP-binding protein
MTESPLFELDRVSVDFKSSKTTVHAVHQVCLQGYKGKTMGIVGESGSGKSTLARALLQLETISSGQIFFQNKNISSANRQSIRKLRRHMQLIFQDPDATLNPRQTARWHLQEVFSIHFSELSKNERQETIASIMETVHLDPNLLDRYHFELSGGQKQRLIIARALILSPALMVLDEPLSSLDASLRKSILELLKELQTKTQMGYLFITHDLSTLGAIADTVAVMYRGAIVECASTKELYSCPTHPYTQSLLSCIPIADPHLEKKRKPLFLPATKPPLPTGTGCLFAHRCPLAKPLCYREEPVSSGTTHTVACHYVKEAAALTGGCHGHHQ